MLNFALKDRVLFVTGGGSGIGRAVALAAARDGCRVGVADVRAEAADAVAAEITAAGGRACATAFDVADAAATTAALDKIERELGRVSLVVACAGISQPQPAELMTEAQWGAVIAANLTGVFNSLRLAGSRMIGKGGGSMVAISSVNGLGAQAARTNYNASKFGVIGVVKTLAIEWGRHGIRVNAVAPGVVDTPLIRRNIPIDTIEGVMLDRVPMGRFCNADEIANACLFLLSDAGSYVNGTVLAVDGGLTAGFFTHLNGADYASNALAAQLATKN